MLDFREQLRLILRGRVGLVGLGNTDYGDDGLGVRLAMKLGPASRLSGPTGADGRELGLVSPEGCAGHPGQAGHLPHFEVVLAGTAPERFVGPLAERGLDTVLFLDAVEFGAAPGSVVLLNSSGITARFPQISTHRISLGLLAKWIEASGTTKAWLLGVQPESLKSSAALTPRVQTTLETLRELLCEVLVRDQRRSAQTCPVI